MENLDADPGIGNLKQSGDLASKVVNIDGKPIRSSLKTQGVSQVGGSYAQTVEKGATVLPKDKLKGKHINFRYMESNEKVEDVDVVLSKESVRSVQEKLACTLYGYFLGDRVAFQVMEYFARTNWKRFGLQKIMLNANGFYFFKFDSDVGMREVLEGGPWLVRNKPIILNKWTSSTQLKKVDVKTVATWVKLHNVPLAAYTDDGLSMLFSRVGNPRMLDSYSTTMCTDLWGRSSYARALVDISAEKEWKETLMVAIPGMDENGYTKESIEVEYEWKPPKCSRCLVFGHSIEGCPLNPKQEATQNKITQKVDKDGFTEVSSKGKKKIGQPFKPKQKFEYRPINIKLKNSNGSNGASSSGTNQFEMLDSLGDDLGGGDEVEVGTDKSESAQFLNKFTGASTPGEDVSND